MEENLDFSKICRVCLSENTTISIFSAAVHKRVMFCSTIQVWPNDGLPSRICNNCLANLHVSYQFKKLCAKSDDKLKQYLKTKLNGEHHQKESHEGTATNSTESLNNDSASDFLFVECTPSSDECDSEPIALSQMNCNENKESDRLLSTLQNEDHIKVEETKVEVNVQDSSESKKTLRLPPEKLIENKDDSNEIKKLNFVHCPICKKEFVYPSFLQKHMERDHIECAICLKTFRKSGYKAHMRTHSEEKSFQCSICDKRFLHKKNIGKHMKSHNIHCPVCSKTFATKASYKTHLRTHSVEKAFQCTICHKDFANKSTLKGHMISHTGSKKKPEEQGSFPCPICDKIFNIRSELMTHCVTHAEDKPYGCDACDKRFSTVNNLEKHKKTHTLSKNS